MFRPRTGNSRGQMWGHQAYKLSRAHNLRCLPIRGEVAQIPRDQVVRSRLVRALEELVVVGIAARSHRARRGNKTSAVLEQVQELHLQAPAYSQLWTRQDNAVLRENGFGHVQPSRLADGQQENGAL